MSNKPQANFRSAAALGISMGVWISEKGNPSFKVQKRYKDQESGEWKETQYLSSTDLAGLIEVAQRGLAYAAKHYEQRSAQRASDGGEPQPRESIRPMSQKPLPEPNFEDDDIPF